MIETDKELIQLFEQTQNITETLNIFLERYPTLRCNRPSLAQSLVWYRRDKKTKIFTKNLSDYSVYHNELITLVKQKLELEGYRTVVIGNGIGKIPDIIALKDNKLFQIEVESQKRNQNILKVKIDKQYDGTLFFGHTVSEMQV